MDIKVLIGAIGRPWLIEPTQAQVWGLMLNHFINTGSLPQVDKRSSYTSYYDNGPIFRMGPNGTVNKSGEIQVLRMNDPIAKYDYCGTPGNQTWTQLLNNAYADETVKGVLIWADSPGGQSDGTEVLSETVSARNKPVVTFCDGMLCSGMYWICSGSDEIIVDDSNDGWNCTIGSIGAMCMWEDDSKKAEKEGVVRHFVFADTSPDKWGDYFAAQKGDYTRMKQVLNGLDGSFMNGVKKNRGDKLNLDKENVLTGKTYNTNEAIKYGLADKKGNFGYAVKRLNSLIRNKN